MNVKAMNKYKVVVSFRQLCATAMLAALLGAGALVGINGISAQAQLEAVS